MKAQKITYWITTSLFAAFMLFSAIPNITMEPEAVLFITNLGYPEYFIPFIGVAKLLGSVALLIPPLKGIKEWAYAGLFFDLIAAVYSIIVTQGVDPGMLLMIPVFGVGITSYVLNRKLLS